jgi:hypothetical protein
MPQLVHGLKEYTAVPTAIADSIHSLLVVRDSVYQSDLGTLAEDVLGFLACDLTSQAILDDVAAQTVEMETHLDGASCPRIFAVGRVWIDVFSVPARTGGHSEIVHRIQDLDNFLIG